VSTRSSFSSKLCKRDPWLTLILGIVDTDRVEKTKKPGNSSRVLRVIPRSLRSDDPDQQLRMQPRRTPPVMKVGRTPTNDYSMTLT